MCWRSRLPWMPWSPPRPSNPSHRPLTLLFAPTLTLMEALFLSLMSALTRILTLTLAHQVAASAKRCPLPPPRAGHTRTAPTPGEYGMRRE